MKAIIMYQNHNNLFLSCLSALGSILSGVVAVATQYHIMWFVSGLAALVSLYAGFLTIKEKRLSIKLMKAKEKEIEKQGDNEQRNVRLFKKSKGGHN